MVWEEKREESRLIVEQRDGQGRIRGGLREAGSGRDGRFRIPPEDSGRELFKSHSYCYTHHLRWWTRIGSTDPARNCTNFKYEPQNIEQGMTNIEVN